MAGLLGGGVRRALQLGLAVVLVPGFFIASAAAEFRTGRVQVEQPLDNIKVTITVGEGGDELSEPVDLHLGIGFPLRLFPLGTDKREPAFAAIPQKTSLAADARSIKPGESATFEFSLTPPEGEHADVLRVTPELLRELRVRDLQRIGFASVTKSDWVLQDYKIEVNGALLAEHTELNARGQQVQLSNQAEMQKLLGEFEVTNQQAADLETSAAAGLATPAELASLDDLRNRLAASGDAINALAARVTGALPWFTEDSEGFPQAGIVGDRIKSLEVTLTPQIDAHSGSRNPLYFWADGRKYSLTSEAEPLIDGKTPQTFYISEAELEANPLARRRVQVIGIGMVGSDEPAGAFPNRARLNRVEVWADGNPLYDSDGVEGDKQVLRHLMFIPPAHRNEKGKVLIDEPKEQLVTLWKSGGLLPPGAETAPEPPPEPEADPNTVAGEEPAIIFVPYDNSGLNSPRRRRPRKRKGPTQIVINVPPAAPINQNKKKRPVTPTPAPAAPVLANIRINPNIPILRDGDQATVNWQVSGNTSQVTSYRVDLFGVLPHKNPPLINTPMATQTGIPPTGSSGAGGSATLLARPPAIQVSNIQSQLTGNESSYLYVQPKVTALGANGQAIVSGFGSILPLFPKGSPSPYTPAMLPGAVFANGNFVAANVTPPSFQVMPVQGAPLAWASSPSTDPQTPTTSWPLYSEQDASFALTFASYVAPLGVNRLPAYNIAVRPASNGERIAIQYEAAVPLPSTLSPKALGYRVVGHVAYLGGTATSTAAIQTRANVLWRPNASAPFFTMQTPSPMPYAKFSSGSTPAPCLLIDMPLRFDLMRANNVAASQHDTSKYAITSFVRGGNNGVQLLGRTAAGQVGTVAVTLMIGQQTTDTTDAIGVFGLRLVPIYQ